MKKPFILFALLLGFADAAQAQNFSLKVDAGFLAESDGTTPVPVGGLLELIASPTGTFSAPNSLSYTSGDNVLVASFAMNYTGGTGEYFDTLSNIPFTVGSTAIVESNYTTGTNFTLTANESLLLRFYPSLTYASSPASPTLATTYGQVRSSTTEFSSTDSSETAWIVPGAGSTVDLNYLTISDNGTYTNSSAYATDVVLVGTVPEPSTYALLASAFTCLLSLRVRKRPLVALPLF